MLHTFNWKREGASYELSNLTAADILKKWMLFDTKLEGDFFKMKNGGSLLYGYVLPKDKDIEKIRPIVSYAGHPWKHVLNLVTRVIMFLMWKAKVDNVLWGTMDLKEAVKQVEDWASEKNEVVLMLVGDIKSMYTVLSHVVILKALDWLVDQVKEKVRGCRYVRARIRGRGGVSFGSSVDQSRFAEIRLKNISKIVQFNLLNSFVGLGDIVVRQTWGIPMSRYGTLS